jgi:hypothetical protein
MPAWDAGRLTRNRSVGHEPRSEPAPPPDHGRTMLPVIGFGLLSVLIALGLAGRLVTEYRAVSDSLTQTRAYWAAIGQASYVLSRTAQSGGTSDNGNSNFQAVAQGYLNEIATGPTSLQTWLYPDVSAYYQFTVNSTVTLEAPANGNVGEMLLKFTFGTAPPPPGQPNLGPQGLQALRTIAVTRPVEFRYCVVPQGGLICSTIAAIHQSGAGQLITSIHRPVN